MSTKISALTDGTTANGTDKIPVARSTTSRYITPAYIWTYIQALTGNMAATARTAVRKNSTGSVYERRRLNFVEGSNVTLTVADDSGNEEVDITIAASGGGGAPTGATYITQTHDATLSAEQALGDLGTGIVKNTTTTGVLSIATGADLPGMVASGASHSAGAVPDPGASSGTTKFLREDASWQVPPAAGSAGGDLSGTYPNPTVAKVNGIAVTGTPSTGQVPTATSSSAATWQTPSSGFANPMTTAGDLIVGDTGGAPVRLAKGSDSQVLTVDPTTHLLVWAAAAGGYTDPLTTRGDLVTRGASSTGRLAVGSSNRVLKSDGTDPAWGQVTEAMQLLADNTTNDVSTSAHGYAPKAPADATKYLDGSGAYSVPAGGATNYIIITDRKTAGTEGGTFSSGAWQQRDLNTEEVDTGNHASVASNQITLAAGTYRYQIRCPAFLTNYHQARLYDVTNSAVIRSGTNGYAQADTTESVITGRMVVSGTTVFKVEHRAGSGRSTNGFGVAVNGQFTVDYERYTTCEFWRE